MTFIDAYKVVGQIIEGIKDVKITYVDSGKVPENIFNHYVERDRSPTKKFVGWMCREYLKDTSRAYHLPDVVYLFLELCRKNLLPEKDIYRYSSEEIESKAEEAAKVKTKGDIKKELQDQIDVAFEDDKLLILHPKTEAASQQYGKASKWCISADRSSCHFDRYTRQGNKFYFVLDKVENRKYAVQVSLDGKTTVWNQEDTPILFSKFLKEVPAMKQVLGAAAERYLKKEQ